MSALELLGWLSMAAMWAVLAAVWLIQTHPTRRDHEQ